MKHQPFIASYLNDLPWLRELLRSFKKYSHGFEPPMICTTTQDAPWAATVIRETYPRATLAVWDGHPGYLRAQIAMLKSDLLCSEADYIYLFGSDCFITGPISPALYWKNELPIMLYSPYAKLLREAPAVKMWQQGVEMALGFVPPNEYMRRLPLVYPRRLFDYTRQHIEQVHQRSIESYIYWTGQGLKDAYHSKFSESNVLGAMAWEFMPQVYHWVDTYSPEAGTLPPSPVRQFWSHGGLDRPIEGSSETPRQIIARHLP